MNAVARMGVAAAVVLACLLAACGSPEEVTPLALEIVDAVNRERVSTADETAVEDETLSTSTSAAPDVDCITEVIIDEYGFEVELSSCDGDPSGDATGVEEPARNVEPSADAVLQSIADDDLRGAAEQLIVELENAGATCAAVDTWTAATQAVLQQTETFLAQVLETGEAWIGTTEARQFAVLIRNRLVLQSTCTDGFVEADGSALDTAAAAARVNDSAVATLSGMPTNNLSSDFWYHRWEAGHVQQLERLTNTEGPPQLLVVGSSVGKHGINPHTMASELGLPTYNASVPGLVSEVSTEWWATIRDIGVSPSIVVIARAPFEDFNPCDGQRLSEAVFARQLRERAFSTIPYFDQFNPHHLASRDADELVRRFEQQVDELGWLPLEQKHRRATQRRQIDQYETILGSPQSCDSRQQGLADFVADLAADPSVKRVLVVDFPLHPEMVSLHPEGVSAFDHEQDKLTARLPNDVEYLDLRSILDASEFLDLTHANIFGQQRITEHVIQALAN